MDSWARLILEEYGNRDTTTSDAEFIEHSGKRTKPRERDVSISASNFGSEDSYRPNEASQIPTLRAIFKALKDRIDQLAERVII